MKRHDDLVIDVGMHTGEDTARFLTDGFRVVAIEANPRLVEAAENAFRSHIKSGQLTIVGAAIADEHGTAPFAISDENSEWSTFSTDLIERNERFGNTSYRYVDVETIRFEDVLERFGVPFYLKIDIEGSDLLCVRALDAFEVRPVYVSIESVVSTGSSGAEAVFDELSEFWSLGYRRFRYVQQVNSITALPSAADRYGDRWHSATTALAVGHVLRVEHACAGYGGRWAGTFLARAYAHARWRLKHQIGWFDLLAALP